MAAHRKEFDRLENGCRAYKRQCEHCLICFKGSTPKARYCSPFCSSLEHGQKVRKFDDDGRVCNTCGVKKPKSEFVKNSNGNPYPHCNDCRKHLRKKWKVDVEKRRANVRRRYHERDRHDPRYKLDMMMKARIWEALKNGAGKNGRSWQTMVSYSVDQLKRHLEKLFQPGMTWENYGQWVVDHSIPRRVFKYTSPNQLDFKRCWALKNLRPMWATENMQKSGRLDKPFQPTLPLEF